MHSPQENNLQYGIHTVSQGSRVSTPLSAVHRPTTQRCIRRPLVSPPWCVPKGAGERVCGRGYDGKGGSLEHLVVCRGFHIDEGLPSALGFGDDVFDGFVSDERPEVLLPVCGPVVGRGGEFGDGAGGRVDAFVGKPCEPAFGEVDRGARARGVVEVPPCPGWLGQLQVDSRGLVGAEVVQHLVPVELIGHVALNLLEKPQHIRTGMALAVVAKGLPATNLQRCEPIAGAAPLVFMRSGSRLVRFKRQRGLAAVHGAWVCGFPSKLKTAARASVSTYGATMSVSLASKAASGETLQGLNSWSVQILVKASSLVPISRLRPRLVQCVSPFGGSHRECSARLRPPSPPAGDVRVRALGLAGGPRRTAAEALQHRGHRCVLRGGRQWLEPPGLTTGRPADGLSLFRPFPGLRAHPRSCLTSVRSRSGSGNAADGHSSRSTPSIRRPYPARIRSLPGAAVAIQPTKQPTAPSARLTPTRSAYCYRCCSPGPASKTATVPDSCSGGRSAGPCTRADVLYQHANVSSSLFNDTLLDALDDLTRCRRVTRSYSVKTVRPCCMSCGSASVRNVRGTAQLFRVNRLSTTAFSISPTMSAPFTNVQRPTTRHQHLVLGSTQQSPRRRATVRLTETSAMVSRASTDPLKLAKVSNVTLSRPIPIFPPGPAAGQTAERQRTVGRRINRPSRRSCDHTETLAPCPLWWLA